MPEDARNSKHDELTDEALDGVTGGRGEIQETLPGSLNTDTTQKLGTSSTSLGAQRSLPSGTGEPSPVVTSDILDKLGSAGSADGGE